jgi:hypothetical protein
MFNIEQYLKRFSKNLSSVEDNKSKVIEIINKYSKIKTTFSDIEIKNYIVFVKTNAVGKNQLFLNKTKILEEIKSENINIIDIR